MFLICPRPVPSVRSVRFRGSLAAPAPPPAQRRRAFVRWSSGWRRSTTSACGCGSSRSARALVARRPPGAVRRPPPAARRPSPVARCQSPIARCPSPGANRPLPVARRPMPIARPPVRSSTVARRPMLVAHRPAPDFVARCPSPIARRPSPIALRMPPRGHSVPMRPGPLRQHVLTPSGWGSAICEAQSRAVRGLVRLSPWLERGA